MALFVGGIAAVISSMKNVALFALIGLSFISVSNAESQCNPSNCQNGYFSAKRCCGDDCVSTVSASCFHHFCHRDWDCSNDNDKDKLICCTNKCEFGSSCAGRSCSLDSDCSVNQACCHSKCVHGINCAGQRCEFDSDCSVNQACCNSKCVQDMNCAGHGCSLDSDCSVNQSCCYSKCVAGKSCLGQPCDSHFGCSSGQSCCNGKCKSGLSCIGESCSSKSDCQVAESCCRDTCSKGDCVNIASIVVPVAVFVLLLNISLILVYRRYSRRRKLMAANNNNTREDSTEVLTEEITTSIFVEPVTQSNPVYQPEGPQSSQQTVPYTESEGNHRSQQHQREDLIMLI